MEHGQVYAHIDGNKDQLQAELARIKQDIEFLPYAPFSVNLRDKERKLEALRGELEARLDAVPA
jgi:hypothetical protein